MLLGPRFKYLVLFAPFLFFPLMLAGMWVSDGNIARIEHLPRRTVWASFALLLIVQMAVIWRTGPVTRWDKLPLGLVGIAMLLLFACGISDTFAGSVLRWYGEASLAIFLISPFIQGASRELVLRLFHTTGPLPQLVLPVLLASTIPALLWHTQRQLHIGWAFHWPDRQN